jgi:hypothetical protein
MLGEKVIVAAGTFLGQGLGWHLLAMGFLFMGSQWLLWNADFCKCHTALSE